MLRQLLLDHFNLFVHIEGKATPAYRLVRSRRDGSLGPWLRPADASCAHRIPPPAGLGQRELRCVTIAEITSSLLFTEALGRPIVDRTGLTERFDVSLSYAPSRTELAEVYELTPADIPPDVVDWADQPAAAP